MDFSRSKKAQSYVERVTEFMQEHVLPAEPEYHAQVQIAPDRKTCEQRTVLETLKAEARAAGLWNLFLPGALADGEFGAGLTNVEYAPVAEITGQSSIASEG